MSVEIASISNSDSSSDSLNVVLPRFRTSIISVSLTSDVLNYDLDASIIPQQVLDLVAAYSYVPRLASSYTLSDNDLSLPLSIAHHSFFSNYAEEVSYTPFRFSTSSNKVFRHLTNIILNVPCLVDPGKSVCASAFATQVLVSTYDPEKQEVLYANSKTFFSTFLHLYDLNDSQLLLACLLFRYLFAAHVLANAPLPWSYYRYLVSDMACTNSVTSFIVGRYSLYAEFAAASSSLGDASVPVVASYATYAIRFGSIVDYVSSIRLYRRSLALLMLLFFLFGGTLLASVIYLSVNFEGRTVHYNDVSRGPVLVSRENINCLVNSPSSCSNMHIFGAARSLMNLGDPSDTWLHNSSYEHASIVHSYLRRALPSESVSQSVITLSIPVTVTTSVPKTIATFVEPRTVTKLSTYTTTLTARFSGPASEFAKNSDVVEFFQTQTRVLTETPGVYGKAGAVTVVDSPLAVTTTVVATVTTSVFDFKDVSLTALEIALISVLSLILFSLVVYAFFRCCCSGRRDSYGMYYKRSTEHLE